jgi:hypothetical protein
MQCVTVESGDRDTKLPSDLLGRKNIPHNAASIF